MEISRKEFFRKGFISLGRTVLDITDTIKGTQPLVETDLPETVPSGDPRPNMVATQFNERCLARNCGCFACVERCQSNAITVIAGEGVKINETICTGCGTCEFVCPIIPKAVILQPRQ